MTRNRETYNAYMRNYWQKNPERVRAMMRRSKAKAKGLPVEQYPCMPQKANKTPEFTTAENELVILSGKYETLRQRHADLYRKYKALKDKERRR